MKVSENGTQFDRYGAFWIGGVELLRTTTAEPTADGIEWAVEKDVTLYMEYLRSEHTAYLSIPNNIDKTYTGIPLVSISLTFYSIESSDATEASSYTALPPPTFPTILPLSNNPGNWSALAVTSSANLSYFVTLPYDGVVGVEIEVMASAHGCEEFWYTNVDNNTVADHIGLCGGGVYRELQVYVDGKLAGSTYPFPVVYTGGINPLLWRPLTGIMSFDIPAYSFDLSPFVLGDGLQHKIMLTVKGVSPVDEGGVWYVDATLLLFRDVTAAPVSGGLTAHSDAYADVQVQSGYTPAGYAWITNGTHDYTNTGVIKLGNGRSMELSTSGRLKAVNSNLLSDRAATQSTSGFLWAEAAVVGVMERQAATTRTLSS
jgi:hypothetical protein